MMHYRSLLFFCLIVVTFLGTSTAFAAEPKLAFDLVPAPYLSATDIEEPAWRNTPYDTEGGEFLTNIRLALQGNAVAMAQLAITTEIFGDLTEKRYPRIPHAMHQPEFWTTWAERFTSKGWVMLRKGYAETGFRGHKWFYDAADAGNAEAMHLASGIYQHNAEDRKKWFWKSLELGYGRALLDLAKAYYRGGLVEETIIAKDALKSREYYKKSAAAGEVEGLISEAFDYANGEGGRPKDPVTAYVYYILANHFANNTKLYFFGSDNESFHRWIISQGTTKFEKIWTSLSPEAQELAEKTATDWVNAYNALITNALEEARKRREPVLEEFRKELAPVIEWLAEQDAATAEKSR